jgi:hypothetical protein
MHSLGAIFKRSDGRNLHSGGRESAADRAAGFSVVDSRLPAFMRNEELASHIILFNAAEDDLDQVHDYRE